jgi:hypothetical protein
LFLPDEFLRQFPSLVSGLLAHDQLFSTEPFGHIDCGFRYQYLMNEPFGRYISGVPPWVNGSLYRFPHKPKSGRAV